MDDDRGDAYVALQLAPATPIPSEVVGCLPGPERLEPRDSFTATVSLAFRLWDVSGGPRPWLSLQPRYPR